MEYLPHEKQIVEYKETIEKFKKQNQANPLFDNEIEKFEKKLTALKKKIYSELSPWERMTICRHPARPHTIDYIQNLCEEFQELSGDRLYRDDQAVLGGLATIGGMKCVIIGQEKGNDTESRIKTNFGMLHPEGFRKALRLMKMAEKFNLPIVSLLDTAGAYPGLEAEERGQGWAIAHNLRGMSSIRTPMIVVIIGEGFSGGALGMGIGDAIGMLQHSCYSVISPEGCASILWKDASRRQDAAEALRLNAEDMLEFGVIDDILNEPLGGAHHDPEEMFKTVKTYLTEQWEYLKEMPTDKLLELRYDKFRKIGQFIEENPPMSKL